ncbi:MAG: Transcription elongation factor SPT5, partial [Paramarteilia canceri]
DQTVGLIVQIDKEDFKILIQNGKTVSIKRRDILKKKNTPKNVALDSEKNPLSCKSFVKVIFGPMNGNEGHVISIIRHFVYVKSKTYPNNGGIFVVKASNVKLNSTSLDYGNTADIYQGDTNLKSPQRFQNANFSKTPGLNYTQLSGSASKKPGFNSLRTTFGQNSLIGCTVRIKKGPYKTYSGIVKATTDSTASIELTAEYKTINVDLSRIETIESDNLSNAGNPNLQGMSSYWNTPYNAGFSGANQVQGQTPRGTFATPMYDGSRTPRVYSKTPVHQPTFYQSSLSQTESS